MSPAEAAKRIADALEAQVTTIAQAFEAQVDRTPEATAVVSAGRSLTYRELDYRANKLARYLQERGVGPDVLVGISVGRSLEMMIALVAILKAGGAYVPMDPHYPEQRISLMIEDSGASIVVATESTRAGIASAKNVVSIDGDAAAIAMHGRERVASTAGKQNLAYVMYTSGSTGRPKGVMVEHGNVLNFFNGMDRAIGAKPGVWLAVTSISFDISILELFWTLTRGFQVVLHGDEGTQTIADEIRNYGVTHMQSTPSLARMVALDANGLVALGSLKTLLLGGEALPASLVKLLRTAFGGELHNMYGPTETTIWSTTCRIDGAPDVISIGAPILNTDVYILDAQMQPVPAGEVGDLYIGGDGVARGYWKRPELTAERFIADPFKSGNRIYRTGDVARMLPDGNLEFLGRQDFQVKLRGHRIELGEIESALENQAGVAQAAVVAHRFREEDVRLVGYVVAKPGEAVDSIALRAAMLAKLPDYMVPSNFVLLERFPLTANGKIDRKALPDPAKLENSDKPKESPRSDLENVIARTWKQALGVDSVGMEENFFDLGAHSLMVAEVHIQLQQQLGREFSLVDLFQFPTVAALATHLTGQQNAPAVSNRAARRLSARRAL
ncbi:MAG TPA: non-ribosomal peptide synthetase [candidate division Zixibacteria bacterium]|nr:non-ribosomal peptide synthetase [candidate division Zixibacteria bacterium]